MHIGMWYYDANRKDSPIKGVEIPESKIELILQGALASANVKVTSDQIRVALSLIEEELREQLRQA